MRQLSGGQSDEKTKYQTQGFDPGSYHGGGSGDPGSDPGGDSDPQRRRQTGRTAENLYGLHRKGRL